MFGFYDINKLTIGNMSNIINSGKNYDCVSINKKFILKKIKGAWMPWQYKYEDIVTNKKYRLQCEEALENELVVEGILDIKEYLNEREIKTGKISKHRLYQIYILINYKENEVNISHKTKRLSLHNV